MPRLIGFGYDPFGEEPFGFADYSDGTLWDFMPEIYRIEDEKRDNIFRNFIISLRPIFDEILLKTEKFPELRDANKIWIEHLKLLANDYGVVIDDNDVEYFKRSSIRNAFKWFGIKGTRNAYDIIGKIYGFAVEVKELYWTPSGFTSDPPPGGETCDYCKSHTLELWFTPAFPVELTSEELADAWQRILNKVKRVTPIYVDVKYPQINLYSEPPYIERFDVIPADLRVTDSDGGLGTLTVVEGP